MQNKKLLSVLLALVLVVGCALGVLTLGAQAEERTAVTWTVGTEVESLADALSDAAAKTDWTASDALVIDLNGTSEEVSVDANGILFGLATIFDNSGARLPITIQNGTLTIPEAFEGDMVCANSYTFKSLTFPLLDSAVTFWAGSGEVTIESCDLDVVKTEKNTAVGKLYADCPTAAAFEGWAEPDGLINVSLHMKNVDMTTADAQASESSMGAVGDTDGFEGTTVSASDLAVELIFSDVYYQTLRLRGPQALSPVAAVTFTANDSEETEIETHFNAIYGIYNGGSEIVTYPDFDLTINLNGGTLATESRLVEKVVFTGDYTLNITGGNWKKNLIASYSNGGKIAGKNEVNISGGTFSTFYGPNTAADGYENVVNITDGTFTSYCGNRVGGNVTTNVYGGTFTTYMGTYQSTGATGKFAAVNNIYGGTFGTYYGTGGISANNGAGYEVPYVINNMTGGTITGDFYGAGCVKLNHYIENNMAGTEVQGSFYGSKSRGTDESCQVYVINNNLSASVIHGNYHGSYTAVNGVGHGKTDADGTYNVKNKITGGEIKGYFRGCAGDEISGDLLNVITGGNINTRTQLVAEDAALDTVAEVHGLSFIGAFSNVTGTVTNKISGGTFCKSVWLTGEGNQAPTVVNALSGGTFGTYTKKDVYLNPDGSKTGDATGRCWVYTSKGTHDSVTTTYSFPDNTVNPWVDNHYGASGTVKEAVNYYYGVYGAGEFYGSDGKVSVTKNYLYGETDKGPGFNAQFQGSAGSGTADFGGEVYTYIYGGTISKFYGIDGKNDAKVGTAKIENNVCGGTISLFCGGGRRGEPVEVINNVSGSAVIGTYYGGTGGSGLSAATAPDIEVSITNNIGTAAVDAEKAQLGTFNGTITTFYGGRASNATKKALKYTIANNFVAMGESSEIDTFYGGSYIAGFDASVTNTATGTATAPVLVRIDTIYCGGSMHLEIENEDETITKTALGTAPVTNSFTYAVFGFDYKTVYYGGGSASAGDITNNLKYTKVNGAWCGGSRYIKGAVGSADGAIVNNWEHSEQIVGKEVKWVDGSSAVSPDSVTNTFKDSVVGYFRGLEASARGDIVNTFERCQLGTVYATHNNSTDSDVTTTLTDSTVNSYIGNNGNHKSAISHLYNVDVLNGAYASNANKNFAKVYMHGGIVRGELKPCNKSDTYENPQIILMGDISITSGAEIILSEVAAPAEGDYYVVTMADAAWLSADERAALEAPRGAAYLTFLADDYAADMALVKYRNNGVVRGFAKEVDNTVVAASLTAGASMSVEERIYLNLWLNKADVDEYLKKMLNSKGEAALDYSIVLEKDPASETVYALDAGSIKAEDLAAMIKGDYYKIEKIGAVAASDFDKTISFDGSAFSLDASILDICETGLAGDYTTAELDLFSALYNYGASVCIDPATGVAYENFKPMSEGFVIDDNAKDVAISAVATDKIAFNKISLLMADAIGVRFSGAPVAENTVVTMTLNGENVDGFYYSVIEGRAVVDIHVSADAFTEELAIVIYTDGEAALQATLSIDGYVEQVKGMGNAEYAMAQLVQACINAKA